jgi:porin
MTLELLTNAMPAFGPVALLLNPTPEFGPKAEFIPVAPPKVSATVEAETDYLLGDWGGLRRRWSEHGFDFGVQYVAEVASNVSGGMKRGTVYNGLLIAEVDFDFDKLVGWSGGFLHGAMLYPQGRSLTDHYVGDLFVLSNLDADDHVRLFELWLEQSFADDTLSVRLGQMAVDQEFAYTERGALFGNSAFGWFPIAGLNVPSPVYPQGAPGVRLAWRPSKMGYVQAAVVDGNGLPPDSLGNPTNPHGIEFTFDEGALVLVEAGLSWGQLEQSTAAAGSIKLGGWYHTGTFDNVRYDESGLSLANPLSTGIPQTLDGNWGVYLAAEQSIWRESSDAASVQGAGVFTRLGWAPPDQNILQFYAECGVTYTGLLPGRDSDNCGLGVAYGQVSRAYRGLVDDENSYNAGSEPLPDYELVLECDYLCELGRGWSVQPSVQYILHPGGSGATDNALILALRSTVNF